MVNNNKYLIAEIGSKLYLGIENSFDKKKRKHTLTLLSSSSKAEVLSKNIHDLIPTFKLEDDKIADLEFYDFWLSLLEVKNLYKVDDFINQAVKFFSIQSISGVNTFLVEFNADFLYFKFVDKNIYLNSKEVVEKISENISKKDDRARIMESFIQCLSNESVIDEMKYSLPIAAIKSYFSGSKKYSKSFISLLMKISASENDEDLVNFLKSKKIFDATFEPFNLANNLNNNFSYKNNLSLASKFADKGDLAIKAFTVDDSSTYDYDDAITITKLDNSYILYVHITNFSDLFDYKSDFALEAKNRLNTIYGPIENFNLYSDDLISEISLKEGFIRKAISIRFEIKDYEIISASIENTYISIVKNYSYEEFELLLKNKEEFNFLNKLTKLLYEKRIKDADFKLFNSEVSIKADKNNNLYLKVMKGLDSYKVISELMILTNYYFSEFFIENKIPGLYRNQKKSEDLEVSIIDDNPEFYFYRKVSPVNISTTPSPHFGLGLKSYIQMTSPIRRYLDSLMIWQLDHYLKENKPLFSDELLNEASLTNINSLSSNKDKSKKNQKFWVLKFLIQEEIKFLSGYIYASLKDKYVVFFNEFNFFDSIMKKNCRKTYYNDDPIEVSFDYIDLKNLEIKSISDTD